MVDSIPSRPNKSFTQILCKSLLFVLFLIAIPLFPSQASDFINQTILTKVWELVHLLFIGVVVPYGLFCRRNVDVDFDQQPQPTSIDESQSSLVYRIFHTPPIFEDGCQNLSGFDEKVVYFSNQDVVNGSNRKLESQIRFVSKESYGFYGNSLGLPVRSLNSRVGESVEFDYHFGNGSELDSNVKDSLDPGVFGDVGNGDLGDEAFEGVGTGNSEDGFDGSLNLPYGIPRRSKSVRVQLGENEGFANRLVHFRPLSVDETQLEAFNSHSFRSTTSLSSQASSLSNSPAVGSPVSSGSSKMPIMEGEEAGDLKGYQASYPLDSQSSATKKAADAPLNAFHLRRYSSGSLFWKEPRRSLKDKLRDLRESRLREKAEKKEEGPKLLKYDEKSLTPVKSSSRGKSVLTIRGSRYTKETKKSVNQEKQ